MPTYTTNGITWNFIIYQDGGNTYASIGDDSSSSSGGVAAGTNLTGSITIPGAVTDSSTSTSYTVKKIGNNALRDFNFSNVTFPDSVTDIGSSAFRNCPNLTSVTFGNSVETIGNNAFSQSTDIVFASLILPNSVKTIGVSCFNKINITTLTLGNSVETIGENAFESVDAAELTIPSSITSIGNNAFKDMDGSTIFIADQQVISGITFDSPDTGVAFFGATVTTQLPPQPPAAPICFPKGTPVTTDQGIIAIEKLNTDKHTIRGKEIVAITQSKPLQKSIVCFEKDSLNKNVPSQKTLCSMEHKVFYKGEMIKARDIVDVCENVTFVPYNGETLFNVLLKKHDKMMINNLICETLHPKNIMAKISRMKDEKKKSKAIQELTKIIKENNIPEYQKLYASL